MNIFRFEHLEYIYGLILIPILLIFWIILIRIQKNKWNKFGDLELVKKLMPEVSYKLKNWKFCFILLSITFLLIALANPQIGSKIENVKRRGIDLIIAVDISNSMMAEDIKPNRLESSKMAIYKLINELNGDRIGIITFAGEAYTQLPITTDYSAAKMFLSSINTNFIQAQGTNIASAIELGRKTFSNEPKNNQTLKRNKAIVIITDGEDHEEGAVEQAKQAANEGVKVYTIGMGTLEGAPIGIMENGKRIGFKKDKDGNVIISRFNESLLKSIAEAGNGTYVIANNNQNELKLIVNEINKLDKSDIETQTYKEYESRFQIFAGLSILFLLLEIIIGERKRFKFNFLEPNKKIN